MISEPCQIMEHLSAVFAFVNLVPSMSMDVSSKVVSSSVPAATDVTGKWLLSSVDSHVTSQVSGSDELAATHLTREWSLGLSNVGVILLSKMVGIE